MEIFPKSTVTLLSRSLRTTTLLALDASPSEVPRTVYHTVSAVYDPGLGDLPNGSLTQLRHREAPNISPEVDARPSSLERSTLYSSTSEPDHFDISKEKQNDRLFACLTSQVHSQLGEGPGPSGQPWSQALSVKQHQITMCQQNKCESP